MKLFRHIFIIALVVGVQSAIVVYFTVLQQPINPSKVPYRRAERAALSTTMRTDPSPANKAAFRHELDIATRYAMTERL